jgi:hypothetical protein
LLLRPQLQRFEEFLPHRDSSWPDRIRTEVIGISDKGGRSDFTIGGPVGVKRPDGSCYDLYEEYDDEQDMFRSLNAEMAERKAKAKPSAA